MKRKLVHAMSYVFAILILAACSNDELTIKSVKLTDRVSKLIWYAGGTSAYHFEISGEVPEDYALYLTIERYENGEFIENVFHPDINIIIKDNSLISFAISGGEEDGEIIFGSPGGVTTQKIDIGTGLAAHAKILDKKVSLKPDEPVYLAYWMRAFVDSLDFIQKDSNGLINIEDIQNKDLSFLLKAEISPFNLP